MALAILPHGPEHEGEVLALSRRAWAPVFHGLEPAVPPAVDEAFYPAGWWARQEADIRSFLHAEGEGASVAMEGGCVLGWIGIRLHPEDRMGEIHIRAVDPGHQRRGVAPAMTDHAMARMRAAGLAIVMVETGGDPGHAPSRATDERAGFVRWPVARSVREL